MKILYAIPFLLFDAIVPRSCRPDGGYNRWEEENLIKDSTECITFSYAGLEAGPLSWQITACADSVVLSVVNDVNQPIYHEARAFSANELQHLIDTINYTPLYETPSHSDYDNPLDPATCTTESLRLTLKDSVYFEGINQYNDSTYYEDYYGGVVRMRKILCGLFGSKFDENGAYQQ